MFKRNWHKEYKIWKNYRLNCNNWGLKQKKQVKIMKEWRMNYKILILNTNQSIYSKTYLEI